VFFRVFIDVFFMCACVCPFCFVWPSTYPCQWLNVKLTDNKAIVDSRLHPCCATHNMYLLIFITEQTLVGTDAVVLVCSHPLGINMMHDRAHCVKTWWHPQNQKYITYCNAIRGPSYGNRQQAQKNGEVWLYGFWDMRAGKQTDRHTDKQTTYS